MSLTAKAAFNAGVQAFRKAEYNEAIAKFSDAIELGIQNHAVLDSRAAAYEKLGRYKEAMADSRKVIEQFPHLPHGYSRACRLLSSLDMHDKAVRLAQKAVGAVKPTDPNASKMQTILETALLAEHDHAQALKAKECHITKLPVELLALIFEDLVQHHGITPGVLIHVCRQWRTLVLGMSNLWCRLVLDHRGNKQEARTAFWLRHSKGKIRQLRVTTSKNFSECMLKLSPTGSYLDEIEFDFSSGEKMPPLFRFKADPIAFSWLVRAERTSAAMLRLPFEPKMTPFRISRLKLVGVDLIWNIEAQQLENLTSLTVENGNLMVSDLLGILERSPDIQTLEIQTGYENPMPEREEKLVLKSLTTLKILFQSSLLKYIETPSLQTLQFHATNLGKALQDLSPPNPPLVSFSALECTILKDSVLPLPDTLEKLRLTSLAYNVDQVVDALAMGQCPQLRELDLSNTCIGSGPIIRLIKARNWSEPAEGEGSPRIEILTMDRCDGITSESLPWIRSKVPRVSCVYESRNKGKRVR